MDLAMGAFFCPPPSKRQMRGARWLDFLRGRSFFCLKQPLGSCESQGPAKQLAIRPSWVRVLAFNRAREPMPPSRRGALGAQRQAQPVGVSTSGATKNEGNTASAARGGDYFVKKLLHYALVLMRRAHERVVKSRSKKAALYFIKKKKREKGLQEKKE